MSDQGTRERGERRHWAPAEDAEWKDRYDADPIAPPDPLDEWDEPAPSFRGLRLCNHRIGSGYCNASLVDGRRCPHGHGAKP